MSISEREIVLGNKILYVGQVPELRNENIHVFGFSASVETKHPWKNILVFPVPTEEILSEQNVIFSQEPPSLVKMAERLSHSFLQSEKTVLPSLEYKIYFTPGASSIPEILTDNHIPQSEDVIHLVGFIGEFYPSYSMAVCVFDHSETKRQFTFWLHYITQKEETFFLPTVERCGKIMGVDVEYPQDYWAIMSVQDMFYGTDISKENWYADLATYLPKKIVGRHFKGWYRNADTIAAVQGIRAGLFDAIHRRPLIGLWYG